MPAVRDPGAAIEPKPAIYAVSLLLVLAAFLWAGPGIALANRFGPPWQGRVTAERTIIYTEPDRASPAVGPLSRGDTLIVRGQFKDAQGVDWLDTLVGFVPWDDVDEIREPWIAEVAVRGVSIYSMPNGGSGIRRSAAAGSLLRVTGMSPGLEGDTSMWWATTEGFVPLDSIVPAEGQWAERWSQPDPAEAPGGWWGSIRSPASARVGPTTDAPVVGELAPGDRVKVISERQGSPVGARTLWYQIDGGRYAGAYVHSSLIGRLSDPQPNTTPPADSTAASWIVVDRSAATLTLVKGGQAEFVTYVALGRAGVETPTGAYSTFGKYRADDMTSSSVSDADRSYDFPNVPFTQYYRLGGYAIHGTYWHDRFGSLQSQGCINLTWGDAAYLFELTQPRVEDDDNARWTDAERATPVVIVG